MSAVTIHKFGGAALADAAAIRRAASLLTPGGPARLRSFRVSSDRLRALGWRPQHRWMSDPH